MPRTKENQKERELVELNCEFSACTEKCVGMLKFFAHLSTHITLMEKQLRELSELSEAEENVDHTKCECPWRDCSTVLPFANDWNACIRHLNFHAHHTHIKALGDLELKFRKVEGRCTKDGSTRSTIPELTEDFVCCWNGCEYQTNSIWHFHRHVYMHSYDAPSCDRKLRCDWSSCSFTGVRGKLVEHLRAHSQEKTHACSTCGVMLSVATRLEDHVTRQVTDKQSYECSHCSKKFSSARVLRDHLRKHVNMYACMFCEMSCPSPSALRIHILYRHSTERPYNCSQCSLTFKTKFDLATHNLTHEYSGQRFSCPALNCKFTSINLGMMQRHIVSAHQGVKKIFGCHLCHEIYAKSVKLSKHLRKQHGLTHPAGHVKFRFTPDCNGVYRLVTLRFECLRNEEETYEMNEENTCEMNEENAYRINEEEAYEINEQDTCEGNENETYEMNEEVSDTVKNPTAATGTPGYS
ncbi:HINFP [Bugula neritina]|uniref:HINFP n=1 Tax=Bugula neritina TaxID=10212 RepID=A0A7J7KL73_BUGNE|nr:HINFP [Bugula neritina]